MKPNSPFTISVCGLAVLIAIAGTGCATKKFVHRTVSPIEQRVGALEKKTTEQGGAIEELDKAVSRAGERAMTAETKADAAEKRAAGAQDQATLAGNAAGEARSLAEKSLSNTAQTAQAQQMLSKQIANVDNYQLVSTDSVLFAFGRHDLTDESKQKLDEIAQKIGPMKHYVLEVQGFTDKTGSQQSNLELSRIRAAAVVRYLTLNHKVPLHRISVMGYGAESPAADNSTRDGRKQNRRVEIRLFAADQR